VIKQIKNRSSLYLWRERVVTPYEKNDVIQVTGYLGETDTTHGQVNSTSMPPNQKSKQS
jgi:hypothetical protein